jgi:hypothetical protein
LIRANEIIPRLSAWAAFAQTLAGPGLVTGALGLIGIAAVVWRVRHEPRRRSTVLDLVLSAYLLAYSLGHWLVAFNTYDRYLLPILPLILLLMARGVRWAKDLIEPYIATMVENPEHFAQLAYITISGLSLVVFGGAARDASEGHIQVGGDLGEHSGIDVLANYLNRRDLGAIVYDQWLGWELGYYMGAWSDKRRVYYRTPDALASGALSQPDMAPRYFPVPADEPVGPWLAALRKAGFAVSLAYEIPRFRVYELTATLPAAGMGA